jgi:hypothetical protein
VANSDAQSVEPRKHERLLQDTPRARGSGRRRPGRRLRQLLESLDRLSGVRATYGTRPDLGRHRDGIAANGCPIGSLSSELNKRDRGLDRTHGTVDDELREMIEHSDVQPRRASPPPTTHRLGPAARSRLGLAARPLARVGREPLTLEQGPAFMGASGIRGAMCRVAYAETRSAYERLSMSGGSGQLTGQDGDPHTATATARPA